MSDKCFNPRSPVFFSGDEIIDVEDYMLAGNKIKCNRCGRSTWDFHRSTDMEPATISCEHCRRLMGRGVLAIIQSYIESRDEEHISPGLEDVDEDAKVLDKHSSIVTKWYAVARGRTPGVYDSWKEAEEQVKGYKGALHKRFTDEVEAWMFITRHLLKPADVKAEFLAKPGHDEDQVINKCNIDPNKETLNKIMAGVLADFAPALKEVAKLGSMNNKPEGKYERGSWMKVENPEVMYKDAFWRHLLDDPSTVDPTTGMNHDVAVAWNALALVYFRLKREGKV